MEKVTVRKDELLEALKTNREGHRAQFLQAQEGWKIRIVEELERRTEDARNGKFINARFFFQEPEDHTTEYDRAIRMVEMEISDTIVMAEHEFAQYVMDDWGWKAQWAACSSDYITASANSR